jgi:hypothetical protein
MGKSAYIAAFDSLRAKPALPIEARRVWPHPAVRLRQVPSLQAGSPIRCKTRLRTDPGRRHGVDALRTARNRHLLPGAKRCPLGQCPVHRPFDPPHRSAIARHFGTSGIFPTSSSSRTLAAIPKRRLSSRADENVAISSRCCATPLVPTQVMWGRQPQQGVTE